MARVARNLPEFFKNPVVMFGPNPRARIRHRHFDKMIARRDADSDVALGGGEFERVRQEIGDDTPHQVRVAEGNVIAVREVLRDFTFSHRSGELFHSPSDDLRDIILAEFERHLA